MQTYHANVGTRASLTVRANTVYSVCEVSKGRDSIVSVSGSARGDQCADMPGRWAGVGQLATILSSDWSRVRVLWAGEL